MIYVFRLLLIALVFEVVGGAALFVRQALRPDPVLPEFQFSDPFLMPDLQRLAEGLRDGDCADWQSLAEALMGQGFYNHAEIAYRRALEIDDESGASQFGLAFCLERTGRTEESTREYRKAIALAGDSAKMTSLRNRFWYSIGHNFLREEKPEDAEVAFRQCVEFMSADHELAKLLIRTDRADEALPVISQNLERAPMSLRFHYLAYRAHEALGNKAEMEAEAEALEFAQLVVEVNFYMELLEPLSRRVGLDRKMEEYNRLVPQRDMAALAAKLEEMGDLIPADHRRNFYYPKYLLSNAEVALQRKDSEKILWAVDELHKFGRSNAELLQLEGAAYQFQGEMEKAISLWERALLMTANVPLHEKLADYYDKKGDTKRRDYHLSQRHLLQALLSYHNNMLPQADEAIQKALELDSTRAKTWFYRAQIDRYMDHPNRAREAYRRCLKINPNHGRAIHALARLEKSTPTDS